ncbi:MAG: type II toxin-antitoxin system VapC family toxin [Methylomonas sp.]|jgi:tRNA(fMet)-specific endonuclease VapC|uniref:type II toxin-antitoxin system tRNA(fMet)-specific endonuclease VapC n=1 Tax=Methylomonas sp. TaxID=418 RepID=UPI0025F0EA7E|nr:type II toxin-antitoxin system VapC family toxin [Methylomonas sp.]MCK9605801.1 type II toxin-antitoxin system VapC family toxin [Methylomonas sp.]
MLKYLLDTNIVIYVIKQRPIEVLATFNRHHGRMAISAITLAELIHDTEKRQFPSRNLATVEDFYSRLRVLPYTDSAAMHYGSIRAALEKIGQPIGVNDLHIAAHARSQGLVLVSNNLREFERVPGLLMENWLD